MAGATDMTIEMLPIILPRFCGGTSVITVVISSGIMIAVPEAWTTRAATSIQILGDSAASAVPVVNSVIASRNIGRVLKRCSRNPVIGMTTAMVRRNAVVSHCAALASTASASISFGIATLIA